MYVTYIFVHVTHHMLCNFYTIRLYMPYIYTFVPSIMSHVTLLLKYIILCSYTIASTVSDLCTRESIALNTIIIYAIKEPCAPSCAQLMCDSLPNESIKLKVCCERCFQRN